MILRSRLLCLAPLFATLVLTAPACAPGRGDLVDICLAYNNLRAAGVRLGLDPHVQDMRAAAEATSERVAVTPREAR